MKHLRRLNSTILFKCLVAPTMILCVIFRNPILQWIAFGALVLWVAVLLLSAFGGTVEHLRRKRAEKQLSKLPSQPIAVHTAAEAEGKAPTQGEGRENAPREKSNLAESEVFLIRQINYRVTELLKATYPMVSWIWVKRPGVEQFCKGGTWKIQLAGTEPFNYGEVTITEKGAISIVMLQAVPLKEAEEQLADELASDDLLDRTDLKTWYAEAGGDLIAELIDNLNAQGHKRLLVKEDGSVCITLSGKEESVEQIENFPPRMEWEDFCQMLAGDDIKASATDAGLTMAW